MLGLGGGEGLGFFGDDDGVGLVLGGGLVALVGVRAPDEVQMLIPFSCAAILVPATHSVSRFLARSNTTSALSLVVPHIEPSTMHWTVKETVPRIRILYPAN